MHQLTKKDVEFSWTRQCQEAPVLVYLNFDLVFILETDASYQGLGAVLHPVAYSSRALSPPEKNYAVIELETLAVVWAIKRYRVYLYEYNVEVVTDLSAVKALLSNPSTSGKHARWWLWEWGAESGHCLQAGETEYKS